MSIDWQMKRKKLDELMAVDKLADWLGRQDPGEEYIYSDPVFCLMGRYLAAHDVEWGVTSYSEMPSYYAIAAEKPWNFGAALARAKTLALPPPHLELEAQRIEAEPVPAEVFHELAPDDVRLLAPERHADAGDGAAAIGGESLRS